MVVVGKHFTFCLLWFSGKSPLGCSNLNLCSLPKSTKKSSLCESLSPNLILPMIDSTPFIIYRYHQRTILNECEQSATGGIQLHPKLVCLKMREPQNGWFPLAFLHTNPKTGTLKHRQAQCGLDISLWQRGKSCGGNSK